MDPWLQWPQPQLTKPRPGIPLLHPLCCVCCCGLYDVARWSRSCSRACFLRMGRRGGYPRVVLCTTGRCILFAIFCQIINSFPRRLMIEHLGARLVSPKTRQSFPALAVLFILDIFFDAKNSTSGTDNVLLFPGTLVRSRYCRKKEFSVNLKFEVC